MKNLEISFCFSFRYGGPCSQSVKSVFAVHWITYLASKEGIVVALVDGRGTAFQGDKFLYAVYRKLGVYEVEDQIAAVRWAPLHRAVHTQQMWHKHSCSSYQGPLNMVGVSSHWAIHPTMFSIPNDFHFLCFFFFFGLVSWNNYWLLTDLLNQIWGKLFTEKLNKSAAKMWNIPMHLCLLSWLTFGKAKRKILYNFSNNFQEIRYPKVFNHCWLCSSA